MQTTRAGGRLTTRAVISQPMLGDNTAFVNSIQEYIRRLFWQAVVGYLTSPIFDTAKLIELRTLLSISSAVCPPNAAISKPSIVVVST